MLCVVTCEMYKLFSISIILVRFAYIQQKKNNERHQQKKKKSPNIHTEVLAWHTCCLFCKTCQIQKTRKFFFASSHTKSPASIIYFYHHPSMQPSSTPFIFLLSSRARFTSSTNTLYRTCNRKKSMRIQFQRIKSKKKTKLHITT